MRKSQSRKIASSILIGAAWMVSQSASANDPVADCREQSASDAERITCLENALYELSGADKIADVAEEAVTAPSVAGLGAEQILNRETRFEDPNEKAETSAIADVSFTLRGRMIFILENGQIWRQTQSATGKKLRLSEKKDYTATIKPGMISGYKLTINEINRAVRVERLK